jgi:hypothetical protein
MKNRKIVLVFFSSIALCFHSVAQVSDSNDFTQRELMDVTCATEGLFTGKDKIVIDFTKLTPKEWCYPMRNGKVISPFGGARRHHTGADIKTHAGDTIFAAFDGKVRLAKPYSGYGNVIVIRHDIGIETVYSHNKKNLVKVNDHVRAGQPIAIVGRTGRATTEHCHFEIRINGRAYDPMKFFDAATRQLRSQKVIAYKSGKIQFLKVDAAKQ